MKERQGPKVNKKEKFDNETRVQFRKCKEKISRIFKKKRHKKSTKIFSWQMAIF